MSTIINRNLPGNAYDAAVNANTPSITNPYATQLDLLNVNNLGNANLLISGGASWTGLGLVFDTTNLEYQIKGIQYFASAQSITLPPSNPTLPRFDAIVVDEFGVVSSISGTPATNPLTPAVDENYVLIQYVLIGAGATTPSITNEFVYRQGSAPDWLTSSVAGAAPSLSVNFSSTFPTPFEGTQCTLVTAPSYSNNYNNKVIQYAKPAGSIARNTFAFLTFRVFLPAALPTRNILVVLYNNTTVIGAISSTNWGLNMTSANSWQLVSIPTNAFGNLAVTTITSVRFLMTGTTANTFSTGFDRYALDDIKFQSGFGPQINTATIDIFDNQTAIGSTAKLRFINGKGVDWAINADPLNNRINISADAINAYVTPELNITGRSLLSDDGGKFLMMDLGTPIAVVIELNSTIPIPIGAVVKIAQQGTGLVTIIPVVGVTVYSTTTLTFPSQYSIATLTKTDINTWYLEF